jgi:hypothetical protein
MAVEENKEIGLKLIKAVNEQDMELLDELVIPEYVNHQLKLQSREDFS